MAKFRTILISMTRTQARFFLLMAVSLFFITLSISSFVYALVEKVVVSGSPVYGGETYGPNASIPYDESGESDLLVVSRQGKYFWKNNQNLILNKVQKTIQNENGENVDLTIFIDPLGNGQIIIRHMVSNQDERRLSCDQGVNNYIEYRLNPHGRFTFYTGETRPYPYPKPHKCKIPGKIFPQTLNK